MKILEKLADLKQHTYTPNSFYANMITFLIQILNGDFNIEIDVTAVTDKSLTDMNAGTESQEITLNLNDGDGNVHDWFNGDLTVAFTTSDSGVAGDSEASAITSATFVNGVATFTVYYSGTFVNDETVTLTVGDSDTLLGFSLTNAEEVILTVESA